MSKDRAGDFEIFLQAAPGLEDALLAEVRTHRFKASKAVPGGVTVRGSWREVWKANLELRGAGRVNAHVATFRAPTLAELEKRAAQVAWREVLRADVPVRVEATCNASRVYHTGAAEERVGNAIRAGLGAPISPDAEVCVRVRIDNDVCSIAIDTSGELLHKRGYKEAVNTAPIRETMAALLLRMCGYTGAEPVLDPMCGSGTFVIEAAEWAANLKPGRERHFAFEQLATFDAAAWQAMRATGAAPAVTPAVRFYGSDRDAAAITISRANAERSGVSAFTEFTERPISEVTPPEGPPGLVIVNPPYGARLGDKNRLAPLYRALGATLKSRFPGWRVGIVATEPTLARATGLPFGPPSAPIAHGGLRISLYLTGPLP